MDPTRIIDPISDRLPAPAAVVSTVTDVATGLAEQLTDHIGELDLTDTVRRTRRSLARIIPWMSVDTSRRRWLSRRWLFAAAAVGVAVTAAVVIRRRSTDTSQDRPGRDDWSTPSPNGATPNTPAAEREPATTSA